MYKRVLIKLSGEALAGGQTGGFDEKTVQRVTREIKTVIDQGVQVALVVGGGNFWRGRSSNTMDRTKADQIGMLATVMNAIYLGEVFRMIGIGAVVQTPFPVGTMTEMFSKEKALTHLCNGKVVIFAGGIGHPFFSTDTVSALRGAELEVDALFFAKNIDGVYDCDPKNNPHAKKYTTLSCKEMIEKDLRVIDLAAASLCIEQQIPILIFGLDTPDSISKAVSGENIGTLVSI
jgi:uridylate kinase